MNTPHDDPQLLEHYRQNQQQEPSAALDASILAAANAQLRKTQPPSVWKRLHSWLFAGNNGRWSAAFGSLAVVGLAVGLVFNSYQPEYDNPLPAAAPAMQSYSAPAPALKVERQAQAKSAPLQRKLMQENSAADEVMAESVLPSPPVVDSDDMQVQLQQILQLRENGQSSQAQALITALQEQYPTLNIEQELQELSAQDNK